MSLTEWTEVFRLASQRFIREKSKHGSRAKIFKSDLEEDKVQSSLSLEYKTHSRLKREAPDRVDRYRDKFYKGTLTEITTNQEIISILFNLDQIIAGLDQSVYNLVKTYENIMVVMVASNHSLDEKPNVLDTAIEVNPPGLSGAYKAPNIWMTIAAINS